MCKEWLFNGADMDQVLFYAINQWGFFTNVTVSNKLFSFGIRVCYFIALFSTKAKRLWWTRS